MPHSALRLKNTKKHIMLFIRRFITAVCFVLFGAGSLELAFLVLPFVVLLTPDKEKRQRWVQAAISFHFRLFLRLIQGLKLMTLNTHDVETLKQDKGTLIIANHPTLIDVVVLIAHMPAVDCVIKGGLHKNPFLMLIVKLAGYITNNDAENFIQDCQKQLSAGRNIIVFPEGTRTTPDKPLTFQRGVAHISLLTHCPLRLVYLTCHPSTLSKQHKWYDIPDKPFTFTLRVGELIDTSTLTTGDLHGIKTRKVTRWLEQHYTQQLANSKDGIWKH